MFNIPKKGLLFIAQFEGFKEIPYICPAGYLTIGFGHIIQNNEVFKKINYDEALILLNKDLININIILNKLLNVKLNLEQYIAISSLTFNVGCGAFQRSTLRQKINREEFEEVPREFMKWIRGGGKILPGLVKRRMAEAQLFASNSCAFLYS